MAISYISTKNMSREKWLLKRKEGIGGSDASVILGLSDFKSIFELWAEKSGYQLPEKESESLRIGTDLEEYVAKRFEEVSGKKVRREDKMFFNSKYPHSFADIDRKIVGENAGLECKTTSAYNRSGFEEGEIPAYYYVQCQHYMAIKEFERMYLAVLVLGVGFYWFVIERNDAEIEALMDAENKFWLNNVLANKKPDPDGSESCGKAISWLTRYQKDGEAASIIDLKEKLERRETLKSMIDTLEKEKNQIEQEVKVRLETAVVGEVDGYKVTYKKQSKTTVDSKRLREEMPEIYLKYSQETQNRVLRINKQKEKIA